MTTEKSHSNINRLAAGFAWTALKSNLNKSHLPYKLNLNITNRCNSRCLICNIWRSENNSISGIGPANHNVEEISPLELETFLSNNPLFRWVDLTGGEIFMRPDIDKIFEVITRSLPDLYLLHYPTNGRSIDKIVEVTRKVRGDFKGRLVVTVSIDGPQRLHDRLRGIPGSYDLAVETYKRLKSIPDVEVFIGYTCSRYNKGMLDETYNALKGEIPDLNVSNIHLNLAQNSQYYHNETMSIDPNRALAIKDIGFLLNRSSGQSLNASSIPFSFIEKRFLRSMKRSILSGRYPCRRCEALSSTLSISPDGSITHCMFMGDKLGTIRQPGFDLNGFLNKKNILESKRKYKHGCAGCWSACEAYPSILSNIL